MSKKYTTRKAGRSAITGRFKTVEQAEKDKNTSVVETIRVPKKKSSK